MLLTLERDAQLLIQNSVGIEGVRISGAEWKKIKTSWAAPDPNWKNTLIIVVLNYNPSGTIDMKDLMEFQETITHKLYTTEEGMEYLRSVCGIDL